MNYIEYDGNKRFHGDAAYYGVDGLLMEGKAEQRIALFGSELTADDLTFEAVSQYLIDDRPISGYPDYLDFTPGAVLNLYNMIGGMNIGRFYVQNVDRVSQRTVEFSCTDCVGVLSNMAPHGGGVYDGQTVQSIVQSIFSGSGLSYSVGQDVGAVKCYGRLPRDNRRTNLGRLLVAVGATLTEQNGVVRIAYLGAGTAGTIYQRNILYGGAKIKKLYPATQVQLTEHAYYKLNTDETAVLFDNTSELVGASNKLVVFDRACYNLTVTGTLTISESNANYAIVSGTGTLTGKVYTHTQKLITQSTGMTAAEKIVAITDNELIGVHNSDYVAQRMVNFYKLTMDVEMEMMDPDGMMMPGTPVNLTDPFGTARTGWIKSKSFPLGQKTKAQVDIAIDWQPGPYGSSLDAYRLFDTAGSHSWTVPAGVTSVTFYLASGGTGGTGGSKGGDGENGSAGENVRPGSGGTPGAGGLPGKVRQITLAVTPGSTVTINVGAGGAAGAKNGGIGSAGGVTTITYNGTTYSSADGTVPTSGVLNPLTGDVYSLQGPSGVPGGDGGAWSGSQYTAKSVADTQTWTGGQPGTNNTGSRVLPGIGEVSWYAIGGGGSGAAYGANGSNGSNGRQDNTYSQSGSVYTAARARVYGGRGADGPAATAKPHTPGIGCGGIGGNGGGGGGAGGPAEADGPWTSTTLDPGRGGTGGDGSVGGIGGNGYMLALFKQAA